MCSHRLVNIVHSNVLADTCHWCSVLYLFWSDHIFAQWQAVNTGHWCSGFSFLIIATHETEESTETRYNMEILQMDFDLCTGSGV